MAQLQDSIERSMIIKGPIDRVYSAIADPKEIVCWFCSGIEGDFSVGSQPIQDHGEYGRSRIAIVAADPPTYFAWRWVSGTAFIPQGFLGDPLTHPNTLVEFKLEEVDGGTLLRVVETGFASLPEAYRQQNFEDNSSGWEYMSVRLAKFVETGAPE